MPLFFRAALALAAISYVSAQGILQTVGEQCMGAYYDPSRLEKLTTESITALMSESFGPDGLSFNLATRQISRVSAASDPSLCLAERHRAREVVNGVPIHGADFVVTVGACSEADQSESITTNTLATVNPSLVQSADGYMVSSVNVPTGYSAMRTREEAVAMVARIYEVAVKKVTALALEIYPTVAQDYRAWIGTVLVDTTPGEPRLYHVVVDDDSEKIILQCEISGLRQRSERIENLRRRAQDEADDGADDGPLDVSLCQSCAATTGEGIAWVGTEHVECDVQTLYMNNTDRKSLCLAGMDIEGNNFMGPGPVPDLHYNGTLTCNSQTDCYLAPIPDCKDAVSDVHWGAINYLQYMHEHLAVHGGLVKDGNHPVPVIARTHYDFRFCNAFYVPGDHTVTFGDCNCEIFTPLVSTDVVVHEITHGMTAESSNLIYFFESGGLNEAYSDIMACAVEFTINDSEDPPDFTVGESLTRTFLRHMEFPSNDGKSIDNYCQYEVGMPVHYTSGFLNKAYVNAVRRCETWCGSTAECAVLMADTFMYTNLEKLSMASNFKDAAEQTCKVVDEYFAVHSPDTVCTVDHVKDSVVTGFRAVGVTMSSQDCHIHISCGKKSLWESTCAAFDNFITLGARLCQRLNEFLGYDYTPPQDLK